MSRSPRRPARVTPPARGRHAAERPCARPVMPLAERLSCEQAPLRRRPTVPPRSVLTPVRQLAEPMTEPPADVPPADPPPGLFLLILLILGLLLLLLLL